MLLMLNKPNKHNKGNFKYFVGETVTQEKTKRKKDFILVYFSLLYLFYYYIWIITFLEGNFKVKVHIPGCCSTIHFSTY